MICVKKPEKTTTWMLRWRWRWIMTMVTVTVAVSATTALLEPLTPEKENLTMTMELSTRVMFPSVRRNLRSRIKDK